MLDTINIEIELNNQMGECIEQEIYELIYNILNKIRYCDKIGTNNNKRSVYTRLDYPILDIFIKLMLT